MSDESEFASRIKALPKKVVDRIAAGEVVQRPASVVKELIENSLDAQSTSIDIQCASGGMRLLSVTDDGNGIHPDDLKLAATRFATSKLKQLDDLKSIETFGFRGEALASASMVGRLSIISRKRKKPGSGRSSSCAFKMTYFDGAPSGNGKATPSAGKEGTCIKLEDLFYNLPSRKRAFEGTRKENEEYQRVLNIVQRYAVHVAKDGIGFVCRKKGGGTDLNTTSLPNIKKMKSLLNAGKKSEMEESCEKEMKADDIQEKLGESCTRDVIGHIYGRETSRELLLLRCEQGDVSKVSLSALEAMKSEESNSSENGAMQVKQKAQNDTVGKEGSLIDSVVLGNDYGAIIARESNQTSSSCAAQYSFAYKVYGLISNGSYCVPKSSSGFLLFINGRLVESASLKRAIEGIYSDMLPKGAKPFIYLSLCLPGPHLDVNVHPTKREVAFLHEDRLCDALATAVRDLLRSNTTSRTFYTQALLPDESKQQKRKQTYLGSAKSQPDEEQEEKKQTSRQEEIAACDENNESPTKISTTQSSKKRIIEETETIPKKRKAHDPKSLIRTNSAAEQGALEPFLVPTQPKTGSQSTQSQQASDANGLLNQGSVDNFVLEHSPDCELASTAKKIDLSIPGAFASAICRCQVKRAASLPPLPRAEIATNAPAVIRPKKIVPTECSYNSIQTLRKDIELRSHGDITSKLRDSVFVGCINRKRSLLQSGIELLMVDHHELTKELFYQLSLLRFGGFPMAHVGNGGVDVKTLIRAALEHEESVKSFASLSQRVSATPPTTTQDDTNEDMAKQATQCLMDQADMLAEYFSIRLELEQNSESESAEKVVMLTGLPIILDGHAPSPHALPTFLLRLATEVDWSEERPCFEGVCTELGSYYAEIPTEQAAAEQIKPPASETTKLELINDSEKKFVQHTLFPALRFLLVVPKEFASDGSFCKLAVLSKLYKVFERC